MINFIEERKEAVFCLYIDDMLHRDYHYFIVSGGLCKFAFLKKLLLKIVFISNLLCLRQKCSNISALKVDD